MAQLVAFAPGALDAEETRKNFVLNGLEAAEVVECTDSRWVSYMYPKQGNQVERRQ